MNPATVESHDDYCDKNRFSFTILSDPDRTVTGKYGALKDNQKSVQRMVYVIGPGANVIFARKGMPDDADILRAIKEFDGRE